jgi:UDP-N-acetylmuramyl tripeptide synthase
MGQAARIADHVVLTSDNPRDEDPADIARAIREGLADHPAVTVDLDRASAIRHAVTRAKENDIVVLAGKGHEREQWIGDVKRPFSDREVALESISR